MSDDERKRNVRGQGALLRDEIVAAAAALVDSAGVVGPLTLRGVARAAGISAPSIYLQFEDLRQIEDAVLERAFAELDAHVAAALAAQRTPADALVAGCRAYVQFAWEHRARYRFMVAGGGFAPEAVATFARIEAALRDCIADGASASTDPRTDAFLIWVGMHGMATLEKPDRPELRRLGPLDRVALTEALARTLAKLPPVER